MNRLIHLARHLPTSDPALTVAYTPIRLTLPDRPALELRVTAPASGHDIPIVLFSHGYGPSYYIPSKDGYAPLVQFWAERGLAVIQPTHASSRLGGLGPERPEAPFYWRERVAEMQAVLDQIDEVERQAPAVAGRLDHRRIAVAGTLSEVTRRLSCLARGFRVRTFRTRASAQVTFWPHQAGVATNSRPKVPRASPFSTSISARSASRSLWCAGPKTTRTSRRAAPHGMPTLSPTLPGRTPS